MKTVLLLIFTFFAFSPVSFAGDIPARTQDGRDVILHEDGTWGFVGFADPFEVKGAEQAEGFVKHMQCSRGGTIDQYLNKKAEIPSVEDLGWQVYTKEDGFEVERKLLIRQKIESKYRWHIYKTGKVTPLNGKAIGITKE
ncbi:MAG: hypothetical protein GY777_27435 [Candidatus Brocadiaceae bacterium]|nr:hypothetical protein [Candidatus Brocadiaceae bacterium]